MAEKAKEVIGDLNFEHKLIGGKIVSEVLDDIGEGIDFLILDTAHKLPGEVMDFIACLPYLAENATVVVHDVALNFYSSEKSIATKVLFDTVTADKYKADEPKFIAKLANIAAFDINAETKKYIYDVFSCLTYTWAYMPGNNLIEGYGEIVKRCYDDMCQKLYAQAVELQRHHFEKGIMVMDAVRENQRRWRKSNKVFIYGCGEYGKKYHRAAKHLGLPLTGMVVSDLNDVDDEKRKFFDVPVYEMSAELGDPEECTFVVAVSDTLRDEIMKNIVRFGYYKIIC